MKPVLKLFAVLISAAALLFAQEHNPESDKNPFANNPAAVTAGAKLFEQTCLVCHGGEARGSERGPALNVLLKRGNLDGEIALIIRNGIPSTSMPGFKGLSRDQVWQLVSYIRSLRPTTVAVKETATGSVALGEELFFGKAACATCHEINARGLSIGPDLSAVGVNSLEAMRRKILDPSASLAPPEPGRRRRGVAPGLVAVKTKDGRTVRGMRRNEDTYTLVVMDLSGTLHRLDKAQVTEVRNEGRSPMPTDYQQRLSEAELQNLLAYLKSCTGRDAAKTSTASIAGGLSPERIRNSAAEPHNWLTYWGDYQGTHYSPLKQVTTANVKQLQARWAVQMPGDSVLETTPLVIDGVMYTAGMPGQVFALDARTGMQLWKYERKQKVVNPFEINRFSRGVTVLGNRVFVGTLDAALVALDARTGLPLWEVQVADTMLGYSITSPPLAIKDKIIVGVTGGEYGINGFLDSYDAATGKRQWRFNFVPTPGEYGNDSWPGDSWKLGGAPTWLTGSYDPELDLIYWTGGNPAPDMNAQVRKGDNLYSCSVVALEASTGKRRWHYQFTPNDDHDWDANQDVVLVDRMWQGRMRKLLLQANRNGMFYVLDRTDGSLLLGKNFVRQTWNKGFDKNGHPIIAPNSNATPEGAPIYPSLVGGTNFQAPSYDPVLGLLSVVYNDTGNRYVSIEPQLDIGKAYRGGRTLPMGEPGTFGIKAIDAATGEIKWDYQLAQGSLGAGLLTTAGGVTFAGTREGHLIALEAKSGKYLWRFQTGGTIAASPMSYAIDGKQFVVIASAGVLYSFALPED
ncbi:MAG: PQQ-dependent dehydrogenase, methanol/ethanol family [Acidobacteria bacterium]|nr:PQQ-dependent dehydrogenase, methanol/ethanol family [Acidobacteriota bacterium]